jgi:hypothetical protein
MPSGDEVLHELIVLGASVRGAVVLVDVYGSPANVCGTVRFTFRDAQERQHVSALLDDWSRAATPLTFVRTSSSVALQATGSEPLDAVTGAHET